MKNIALITVHGVADQEPYVTAREVANLLVREDPGAGAFYERAVHIAVDPVALPEKPRLTSDELWEQDADFTFMYGQLTGDLQCTGEELVGPLPRGTYDTICLCRTAAPAGPSVHIYEMYWADLSRLSTSFRRIFGEFYQLLFHISSLGRHTVDEARDDAVKANFEKYDPTEPGRKWRHEHVPAFHAKLKWLARAQAAAGHVLTLPIPILNLYLLAVVASLAVFWLPLDKPAVGAGLLAVGTLLGVAYLFYRRAWNARRYWVPLVIGAIAALGVHYFSRPLDQQRPVSALFVIAWCALLVVAFFLVLRAYERRRGGALFWGGILGIAVAGMVVFFARHTTEPYRPLLHTLEAICAVLVIFWGVLLVCHWSIALAGSVLKAAARKAEKRDPDPAARQYRDKVERIVWTGRLAVILPTALFLNVTLALWAAIAYIADSVVPDPGISYEPWPFFEPLYEYPATYTSLSELGMNLLEAAASPVAAISIACMAVAAMLALWAFLPVVLAEVRAPKKNPDGASLGEWLDSGLKLLRWSGRLFFVSVVIVLPIGMILPLLASADIQSGQDFVHTLRWYLRGLPTAHEIVFATGAALAGTAVALIAFSGRLAKFAKRIRPVLDVALDVDNHLREHPLGTNPRAKIAARYVSLLRHVCQWRSADGERYDALVIVAHSQGTVITADVLRFIRTVTAFRRRAPADPQLARIHPNATAKDKLPMYLLTVGCPLRQLYSLRFPDLYAWARHSEVGPWNRPASQHPINHGPDPAMLNVERWINAYRSGDYVGRYLWRPDLCDYRWDGTGGTRSTSVSGDRVEFCIGAGAHTHYFDATAPEIGEELARLIAHAADAAGSSSDVPWPHRLYQYVAGSFKKRFFGIIP
jgi:hypothetical protein